jgi:hypothetical protein
MLWVYYDMKPPVGHQLVHGLFSFHTEGHGCYDVAIQTGPVGRRMHSQIQVASQERSKAAERPTHPTVKVCALRGDGKLSQKVLSCVIDLPLISGL